jgi:hypothetical protein
MRQSRAALLHGIFLLFLIPLPRIILKPFPGQGNIPELDGPAFSHKVGVCPLLTGNGPIDFLPICVFSGNHIGFFGFPADKFQKTLVVLAHNPIFLEFIDDRKPVFHPFLNVLSPGSRGEHADHPYQNHYNDAAPHISSPLTKKIIKIKMLF